MSDERKVGEWLELWRARAVEGWALVQLSRSGARELGSPVATWGADELEPEALARAAIDAAHADADETGGLCRYSLAARARGRTIARHQWTVVGEALSQGAAPDEDPSGEGLARLAMRHADASARAALATMEHALRTAQSTARAMEAQLARMEATYASQLDRAHARIAALEARELEALELRAKLLDGQVERDLVMAKGAQRLELEQRAIGTLGEVVPWMLRRALGGDAAPTDGSLRKLVGQLSDEQTQAMVALLTDAQRLEFFSMLEAEKKPAQEAGN